MNPPPDPGSAPPSVPRAGLRRSGVVVPERATFAGRLAARAIWLGVHGVDVTLRYRVDFHAEVRDLIRAGPAIYTIWHNRLSLCLRVYRRFIHPERPAGRLAAIVSASRDGGMLARALELFGVQPVRGSSSRRGAQALREMTGWAARGFDLAITPDGPRGPRYVVQDGAVDAASLTGFPIIPVGYDLSRRGELKSWDRFQIPLPFARCHTFFGEPLRVPRELDGALRERLRAELQARMLGLSRETRS
jgi:lysophospholipid acyltransferase (LPLAT)-like uncharacterized protein